jgi:hypothetical protein
MSLIDYNRFFKKNQSDITMERIFDNSSSPTFGVGDQKRRDCMVATITPTLPLLHGPAP